MLNIDELIVTDITVEGVSIPNCKVKDLESNILKELKRQEQPTNQGEE